MSPFISSLADFKKKRYQPFLQHFPISKQFFFAFLLPIPITGMKKNRVAIEMDHLKKKKRWAYFEPQKSPSTSLPRHPGSLGEPAGTSRASQHRGLLRLGGGRERLGRRLRLRDAGGESKTLGASKGSVAKGALDSVGFVDGLGRFKKSGETFFFCLGSFRGGGYEIFTLSFFFFL